MPDFTKAPFSLDAEAIRWIEATYERLTPEQRIRQLFNLRIRSIDPADLEPIRAFAPGGITHMPGRNLDLEREIIAGINAATPVPVIVSGDLEGSRMSLAAGTEIPNPLTLAAVDDVDATRRLGGIMASEARAAGMHWSFTPVLDVNAAFRSAIVATRGFGRDVGTIERHAMAQIEGFQSAGIAATAKHWPGEGFDDRDQHLLTTINPLSMAEWEATFGRLYRAAIDAGVMSIMSGHIALPAFVRQLDPDAGIEAFRPASISRALNVTLLRERLGFNGLIVSDATSMAGLGSWSARRQHLPEVIANGCDMILFSPDAERDVGYVRDAVADGRIGAARLAEAVKTILALKAVVGLHRPAAVDEIAATTRAENRAFAESMTRRAPTLVKDTQKLLPIDPVKHRRVLVVTNGIIDPWAPQPIPFAVSKMLEERQFEVTHYVPGTPIDPKAYDLVLYLLGEETLMTRGRISLDWLRLMGNPGPAMQRPWHEVPTVIVSFGYPYYLYDAPRAPAYINAYMTTETMQRAVVDALLGDIPFNTNSPVDPFAGLEDARY